MVGINMHLKLPKSMATARMDWKTLSLLCFTCLIWTKSRCSSLKISNFQLSSQMLAVELALF